MPCYRIRAFPINPHPHHEERRLDMCKQFSCGVSLTTTTFSLCLRSWAHPSILQFVHQHYSNSSERAPPKKKSSMQKICKHHRVITNGKEPRCFLFGKPWALRQNDRQLPMQEETRKLSPISSQHRLLGLEKGSFRVIVNLWGWSFPSRWGVWLHHSVRFLCQLFLCQRCYNVLRTWNHQTRARGWIFPQEGTTKFKSKTKICRALNAPALSWSCSQHGWH